MPLTDKDIAEQLGNLQLQVMLLAAENRDLRAKIQELENRQMVPMVTNEPPN